MSAFWYATLVFSTLALALYCLCRSKPSKISITTTSLKSKSSLSSTPDNIPAFFPKSPNLKSPLHKKTTPLLSPRPTPLFRSPEVYPPYYQQRHYPAPSQEMIAETSRTIFKRLQARPDEDELRSMQLLGAVSFWSQELDLTYIDSMGEETEKHRKELGVILDAMIKIAQEEAVKVQSQLEYRRPEVVVLPPSATSALPVDQSQAVNVPPKPQAQVSTVTTDIESIDTLKKEVFAVGELKNKYPELDSDLKGDINEYVGQINSDVNDYQQLTGCVNRCLKSLQRHPGQIDNALVRICDKVLSQCQMNMEDMTNGPAFAISYMNFVAELSKTYPKIQRLLRYLLFLRRPILIPVMDPDPTAPSEVRMNLTRGYGCMRAAINTHPSSEFTMREGWTWLARVLNVPSDKVDPLAIPALTGYLKVLNKQSAFKLYRQQARKLKEVLKRELLPMYKQRFLGVNDLYKSYIAMLEAAIDDIDA